VAMLVGGVVVGYKHQDQRGGLVALT